MRGVLIPTTRAKPEAVCGISDTILTAWDVH